MNMDCTYMIRYQHLHLYYSHFQPVHQYLKESLVIKIVDGMWLILHQMTELNKKETKIVQILFQNLEIALKVFIFLQIREILTFIMI